MLCSPPFACVTECSTLVGLLCKFSHTHTPPALQLHMYNCILLHNRCIERWRCQDGCTAPQPMEQSYLTPAVSGSIPLLYLLLLLLPLLLGGGLREVFAFTNLFGGLRHDAAAPAAPRTAAPPALPSSLFLLPPSLTTSSPAATCVYVR